MITPVCWTTTTTHDQEVIMKILDFDLFYPIFRKYNEIQLKEAQTDV